MKLYRIINDEFEGFYDTTTQMVEPDFEEFFPIADNEIDELMAETSLGKSIIYVNGRLISFDVSDKPSWMLKPIFNKNLLEWVETATEEELNEWQFNQAIDFYNSELDYASKATAEYVCEIIPQEMFDEVKMYMQAIDPYAVKQYSTRNLSNIEEIKRPSVFDRYK